MVKVLVGTGTSKAPYLTPTNKGNTEQKTNFFKLVTTSDNRHLYYSGHVYVSTDKKLRLCHFTTPSIP
jgi:hypothetical protein